MEDNVMKIVSSAIKFQITGSDYFHILCGKRHCDVFNLMRSLGITYNKLTYESGFMTDRNKFVDRRTAKIIAQSAGQIIRHSAGIHSKDLYSEDLW